MPTPADLPRNIAPEKVYFVSGKTLQALVGVHEATWRGDNINRAPGILKRAAGSGGLTLGALRPPPIPPSAGLQAFPWKMYDASKGSSPMIRVNSGDGFAGSVNGIVATVDGETIDYVQLPGEPYQPPTLPVADGQTVYVYVYLDEDGNVQGGDPTSVVVMAAGSLPANDTAYPPTFAVMTIGTVTVKTDPNSGNVTVVPSNTVMAALFLSICGGVPAWNT